MAYDYLLDLYQLVERRLQEANQYIDNTANNPREKRFHQGRIAILLDFKNFLTDNLNPKLPRRIRERYFGME